MTLFDDLPSDSVLYRHTMTERMRVLGLPPSDSVLRRHHAQWLDMLAGPRVKAEPAKAPAKPAAANVAAAPAVAAAPRVAAAPTAVAAPRVAPSPVPQAAAPVSVAPSAAASSGGIFGWLKRLFGT